MRTIIIAASCVLLACGTSPAGQATGYVDAGKIHDDASAPGEVAQDASAGDAATPPASDDDPTAPVEETGKYVPPGPEFDAEVAALLAYQRPSTNGGCPGLGEAAGCGNGTCELAESEENCPADCVFHLVGAYNDLPICPDYQERVEPHTVAEVQEAVKRALHAGQRVRAVGARHSASASICGDGLAIEMGAFSDVAATRVEGDVAYVQPGVRMIDLGDQLEKLGLGVGFTHLGFRGVTVAGAIGTSAHGSSPAHNNALSHRVVSLSLVLADGTLRTFRADDTEETVWRALTTHLGLFGVIVEVGLRVEKAFTLDTDITLIEENGLLEGAGALGLLEGCDWGQFNWFPHHRQAFRWCGKISSAAPENVDNTLLDPGVAPDLAAVAKAGFHAGTCDVLLNQALENVRVDGLLNNPPLTVHLPDGSKRSTTHAVGSAHRMTSANLINLSEDKYFQMDWEVAVPQQYIQDALRTARRMFDAHDVSLPGVGVFVRFGKIEKGSWLSYHSAGKAFAEGQTAMFFETPVAVPAGYSEAELRDYLHIYQELISIFVRHFGARAHWGKNLDAIFELQRTAGTYAGRVEKMNQAVAELDPYGVFANDFARRIGVQWPNEQEGFSALTGEPDSCGVEADPQCAYESKRTFANLCRAQRAGVSSSGLLSGTCEALVWAPCSAFESTTCVWDRKAREQSVFAEPLARF